MPVAIASRPTSQPGVKDALGFPAHAIDRRGFGFDAAGIFASGRGGGAYERKLGPVAAARSRGAAGLGALPQQRDTLPEIESALRTALEADVVITMGGVSVGAYDFVQGAFKNVGIEPRFWKVRIKPGKRLAFAQYAGKPIVGLPGNPIGAMVTFEILVAPCPRKMLGDPQPHSQPVLARLRDAYTRRPGRVEIARGSRPATETRSSSPCTHSKARALCPRLRVSMPLSSFLPMRPSSAPASRWRRSSGVQD